MSRRWERYPLPTLLRLGFVCIALEKSQGRQTACGLQKPALLRGGPPTRFTSPHTEHDSLS